MWSRYSIGRLITGDSQRKATNSFKNISIWTQPSSPTHGRMRNLKWVSLVPTVEWEEEEEVTVIVAVEEVVAVLEVVEAVTAVTVADMAEEEALGEVIAIVEEEEAEADTEMLEEEEDLAVAEEVDSEVVEEEDLEAAEEEDLVAVGAEDTKIHWIFGYAQISSRLCFALWNDGWILRAADRSEILLISRSM